MHTWDDAFVVTTRRTSSRAGRELTLLDVPAMVMQESRRRARACVAVVSFSVLAIARRFRAASAFAYIGPGAGFALVSSFVTLFVAFAAGALALFTFPARAAIRHWKRRRSLRRARVRKVVMLGLDGLDPDRCEMLMARGELPHLARLRDAGTYRRLGTSMPALSPVAWSTFATGVDPSRHGIFDFIARDPRNYAPHAFLERGVRATRAWWASGPFRIPGFAAAACAECAEAAPSGACSPRTACAAPCLRVPITFPVEKIDGVMIAGMCVPDLRGTQGSFTFITSDRAEAPDGGVVVEVGAARRRRRDSRPAEPDGRNDRQCAGSNSAPPGKPRATAPREPLTPRIRRYELRVNGARYPLKEREYTPWVKLAFHAARGVTLRGIARFYPVRLSQRRADVRDTDPHRSRSRPPFRSRIRRCSRSISPS